MSISNPFETSPQLFMSVEVPLHRNKKVIKLPLYQCRCYPDGSCFFHAILLAISENYRSAPYSERILICAQFRKDLADYLYSTLTVRLSDNSIDTIQVYNYLSRGQLASLSREMPNYSLDSLAQLVDSTSEVGLEVIQLASLFLSINIYIINLQTQKVYNPGDADFLYPADRKAIILLYNGTDHFDLAAIKHPNQPKDYATYFLPDNPLISVLRTQLNLSP